MLAPALLMIVKEKKKVPLVFTTKLIIPYPNVECKNHVR